MARFAERGGLTEWTFFRRFSGRREVLVSGAGAIWQLTVTVLTDALDSATPLEAVTAALEAVGPMFDVRRELGPKRHVIIVVVVNSRSVG